MSSRSPIGGGRLPASFRFVPPLSTSWSRADGRADAHRKLSELEPIPRRAAGEQELSSVLKEMRAASAGDGVLRRHVAAVKLVVAERGSRALTRWATEREDGLVSSDLLRTELLRAVRRGAPRRMERARTCSTRSRSSPCRRRRSSARPRSTRHAAQSRRLAPRRRARIRRRLEAIVAYDDRLAAAAQRYGIPVSRRPGPRPSAPWYPLASGAGDPSAPEDRGLVGVDRIERAPVFARKDSSGSSRSNASRSDPVKLARFHASRCSKSRPRSFRVTKLLRLPGPRRISASYNVGAPTVDISSIRIYCVANVACVSFCASTQRFNTYNVIPSEGVSSRIFRRSTMPFPTWPDRCLRRSQCDAIKLAQLRVRRCEAVVGGVLGHHRFGVFAGEAAFPFRFVAARPSDHRAVTDDRFALL